MYYMSQTLDTYHSVRSYLHNTNDDNENLDSDGVNF